MLKTSFPLKSIVFFSSFLTGCYINEYGTSEFPFITYIIYICIVVVLFAFNVLTAAGTKSYSKQPVQKRTAV